MRDLKSVSIPTSSYVGRDSTFSESDHPRKPDGKFGSGGAGGATSGSEKRTAWQDNMESRSTDALKTMIANIYGTNPRRRPDGWKQGIAKAERIIKAREK